MNHSQIIELVHEAKNKHTGRIMDVEYLVHDTDEKTIVIFRGTEAGRFFSGRGWIDIARDIFAAPLWDSRTGWCHGGFLLGARRVADTALPYEVSRSKPVVLAGHSLGASLSLIAGQILSSKGYTIEEWVGFAPPKAYLGNREFSFKTTGYKYGGDIVTDIPIGALLPYKRNVELIQLGVKRFPNLDDHGLENYINHIG